MVDDRVTDGTRIAQLLASELSGRETGPLATLDVVDADRDAEPSPDGTTAYGVTVEGVRVATVVLYPERADVVVDGDAASLAADLVASSATDADLPVARDGADVVVSVESGAAVKRAVDVLVAGLS